jgi:ethanolamine permease
MEHAEPVQVAPQRAGHGAAFHRTAFFPCSPLLRWQPRHVCIATMVYFNPLIFGLFVVFMALGYGYFLLTGQQRQTAALGRRNTA